MNRSPRPLGTAPLSNLSKQKLLAAKLDLLLAAARELEARPYDPEAQTAALGAARSWARAERESRAPITRRAIDRDTLAAESLPDDPKPPAGGDR
jgi:hypothetical protein